MTAADHAELGSDLGYWEMEAGRLHEGRKLASEFSEVEWGFLKRALTQSLALLSEIEGLKAERAEAKPWQNREDEWSEAISAAHPVNSDRPWKHKCFETAMEMVGNRHGKYELVALVSWLLSDFQSLRTQAPDSWRPDREKVAAFVKAAATEGIRSYNLEYDFNLVLWTDKAMRDLALRPQTAESGT